jgi:hypothetical protein
MHNYDTGICNKILLQLHDGHRQRTRKAWHRVAHGRMAYGARFRIRRHGATKDIMAAWEDDIGESDGTRGTIPMATTMAMALTIRLP